MPELPEVEVVRRGLDDALRSRTIASVDVVGVHGPRALRRNLGGPAGFTAAVTGRRVVTVRRRGKYLWFALDGGDAVLAHLGMSGQFRVHRTDARALPPMTAHTRLRFRLAGDPPTVVDFVDQRTFGGLSFDEGGAELPAPIAHIARDLLDPLFDRAAVIARIRRSHSDIKRVLLNQSIISGIGNIYADESLWAARLHWGRSAESLSARTVGALLDAADSVLRAALVAGGTSFDALYVNVNGRSGYFDRSLQVYGRAGLPCRRCGSPIRREPFMNRSSFRCPTCQRPARHTAVSAVAVAAGGRR